MAYFCEKSFRAFCSENERGLSRRLFPLMHVVIWSRIKVQVFLLVHCCMGHFGTRFLIHATEWCNYCASRPSNALLLNIHFILAQDVCAKLREPVSPDKDVSEQEKIMCTINIYIHASSHSWPLPSTRRSMVGSHPINTIIPSQLIDNAGGWEQNI